LVIPTLRSTISILEPTENIQDRQKIFRIDEKFWKSTISTLESTENVGDRRKILRNVKKGLRIDDIDFRIVERY